MNPAPPKISRANRDFGVAIITMVALGGAAVLFFFNPAAYHFYPTCAFHRLTGLNCPGCGMTRALYALLHGDFSTALRDNALLVLGLAVLVLRGLRLAWAEIRGRPGGEWFPVKFFWPLVFIALVFAVLRNLPAFAFLSPA